ncbi:MAG: chemotaxis protein CheA [Planctomycetales bacterium]
MLQYLQVYIDESDEELESLVEAILKLEGNPQDADALNKSFRMLHSLKGSSGMLGFEVVGNFAHELEDRFEQYRSGKRLLDRDATTLILKCVDFFRSFIARLRANEIVEGDPSSLLRQLEDLESRSGSSVITPPAFQVASSPEVKRAVTISGGLRIVVRFRPGLQLADLKARLIVSRLSQIGEIIACEPAIEDAHSFDELPLFSLTLVTDRPAAEVRKISNVDGVESVEIEGGGLTADVLATAKQTPQFPASKAESAALQESDPVSQPSPAPSSSPARETAPPPSPEVAVSVSMETEPVESRGSQVSETLRIDIERLDNLMNLTGELVIANARFSQITGEMNPLFRKHAVLNKSKDLTERLRRRFDWIREKLGDHLQEGEGWSQVFEGLEEELLGLDEQSVLWSDGHRHFSRIAEAVDQLTRVSKNLQRGVLNTRMVPVGPLFNRFKRVIRDLSVERNKKVQFIILGEKTELDKRMIDALGDPLLHLVRNSIDHGLESSEERVRQGKPESGSIILEASHRGNNVLITVRDDGGGINVDRIRERIVSRGLASEAQVRDMTDLQVIDHIWKPGFSTAEKVTEISGRGVGMDIVRSCISDLNGTIDVASIPGQGTTFTIRLPLTLAIIHSLLIGFREDFFSIAIDDVREIVSVSPSQVHPVQRHLTIDVRGELIPLVSMDAVFSWNRAWESTTEKENNSRRKPNAPLNVVIVKSRSKTLGLCVDTLVGRGDIVIKSLSENFVPVRGLSGASIMGDGTVCLMLDTASLIEMASERALATSVT